MLWYDRKPILAIALLTLIAGCNSPTAEVDVERSTSEAAETEIAAADPQGERTAADPSEAGGEPIIAEPAAGHEDEVAVADPPATQTSSEAGSKAPAQGQASIEGQQKVLLGSDELTAGIPGSGPLTDDDLRQWLDQPENHDVLQFELPMGLSGAVNQIYIPEDNPLTRAKIELGRQLYFDDRLSTDFTISCASCHDPSEGFSRHTQFGVGILGKLGNRNSPVSYNRIVSKEQSWDGRAPSLEEQAVGQIANPIEMGNTHEGCVGCLSGIGGYVMQFEKIFPGEGLTIDTVGKALAAFERVLVTGPAPFDYYEPLRTFETLYEADLEDPEALKEDDPELMAHYEALQEASEAHPMSESAKRGRELFFNDRSGCTACHSGANFTDEKYHNLGVGMDETDPDLGRYEVTKDEKDKGAFKTPTLRNVTESAPYMHDGSLQTLEQVIDWYVKGGHPNPHLSDKIKKLDLTDQEKRDLVEFMKALTGPFPKVEAERLPPAELQAPASGGEVQTN